MPDSQVNGVHHFELKLGGAETDMLFSAATTPTGTLDAPEFKTMDAQAKPVNSVGGGTQASWSEVTITRGLDDKNSLWEWFKAIKENGATSDTKKDITIAAKNSGGDTLHTWNLKGAVITSYGHAGADAQTMAILTQQVSIKFEDADLEM